jgi:thymidylate synthase
MPVLSDAHFVGPTVDDLMRSVMLAIQERGERIESATKGTNTEIRGVIVELTNPRARLSRTETRGKPFSCLGELCWYLSGTNDFDFISFYVRRKDTDNEAGQIFGGYGPRLFGLRGNDQIEQVTRLLRGNPQSRRAAVQLFEAGDLAEYHADIPCTCTLQFMIRNERLDMLTYMRSNDVYLGMPHDIFCFTMMQELLARSLSVEIGNYKHMVGSLHLYDEKQELAQQFLDEGLQSTKVPMPAMPVKNPWPDVHKLLEAEGSIRTKGALEEGVLDDMDPYWADLTRLLLVHKYGKDKELDKIKLLRDQMHSPVYNTFIDARMRLIDAQP